MAPRATLELSPVITTPGLTALDTVAGSGG